LSSFLVIPTTISALEIYCFWSLWLVVTTTIDIDQRRSCYSCEGFGYLAKKYRNQRLVKQERRIEYGNSSNTSNLNEKESLEVLD